MNGSAAGVEFALFLLPISIIHYLPNFFFGSLLMLFGVEILADWLIHSYKKAGFHHPQPCQICRAACAAMLVACHICTSQAEGGRPRSAEMLGACAGVARGVRAPLGDLCGNHADRPGARHPHRHHHGCAVFRVLICSGRHTLPEASA